MTHHQYPKNTRNHSKTVLHRTLMASAVALTLMSTSVSAQQVIDNGETVNLPADRPNPWDAGTSLIVGQNGQGTLTATGLGTVINSVSGILGENTGSQGVVTLADGAHWEISGPAGLDVGRAGKGSLTLSGGGTLRASRISLGAADGGEGTMLITGTGSSLSGNGSQSVVEVGALGKGSLTIAGGGSIDSNRIAIGSRNQGDVKVSGPLSILSSATLDVGDQGKGSLRVENGGKVLTSAMSVGVGAEGNVVVTGQGTDLTARLVLAVGGKGKGSLVVENGGRVSIDQRASLSIGGVASGSGDVRVSGPGSTVLAPRLVVGGAGKGSLRIENGGAVAGTTTLIGNDAADVGEVLVTGPDSVWSANQLAIGVRGKAAVRIDSGAKLVSASSIIGWADGSQGDVVISGQGSSWSSGEEFYIGPGGKGTLTITDGGMLAARIIRFQSDSPAGTPNPPGVGTLNIGAGGAQRAMAAGQLNAEEIVFGKDVAAGVLNFNHTSSNYILGSVLSGKGMVNQIDGSTQLTGNSTAFTGVTNVRGGELRVNGALGGTMMVLDGGKLSGAGTVGTTTIGSGAILAPGNSIGTLNVNGDIRFDAGSIFQIEANPSGPDSDRVNVTGKATLAGGSVVHVGPDGNFTPDVAYTILSSAGGISGTFQGATSNFAFLNPQLSYDANNVYLGLKRSQIKFPDYALTSNQKATSRGIESTAGGHAVYDAVVVLPADGDVVRAAYDSLSGEIHASIKSALLDDSRFIREAALNRAGANGDAGFWVSGYGSDGKIDSDGERLDSSAVGMLIGIDRAIDEHWRIGVAAGYGQNDLDADKRRSSAKVDGYTIAAYAGVLVNGFDVRLGAAYGWQNVDSTRHVVFPGFSSTAQAKYDVGIGQAFAEVGYRFERGAGHIEPFLGLAHIQVESDPYRESGKAGLVSGRDQQDVTFTTLGLRTDTTLKFESGDALLHGLLGWRHALDEAIPTASHAFSAGDTFSVAGAPIARNAALVEAGLRLRMSERVNFDFSYSGQIASDAKNHGLRATVEVAF
jgi:subtilase-type serine protease